MEEGGELPSDVQEQADHDVVIIGWYFSVVYNSVSDINEKKQKQLIILDYLLNFVILNFYDPTIFHVSIHMS